jgi:predicted transcriptional regulator
MEFMKAEPEGVSIHTDKTKWNEMVTEELPKLLFELSHGWRIETLFAIKDRGKRHSELSREMKMSPQETTRHLIRLAEMDLIRKDSEAVYHLTNKGKLILTFVPALNVVSKYSGFFLTHDISGIPDEFILRLGELSETTLKKADVLSSVSKALQVIRKAKGQVWMMNVGRLEIPDFANKEGKDVEIRCILPTSQCDRCKEAKVENCKYIADVKLAVLVTGDVGVFSLSDLEGKMDYTTYIVSEDIISMKWCRDIFEYYWARASITSK